MRKQFLFSLILASFISNANAQWQKTAELPETVEVWSLAVSGNNIFAGTNGGGIYLSSNAGVGWNAVNNGLTNLEITSFAISGVDIFAGTKSGVFLSSNSGSSWSRVSAGLTDTVITALAISGSDLFAATSDGGVFLSSDNGNSWSAVNNGLTNTITFSLAVSGSDIFTTTFGGVYLTSDKGNNWSVANSGLPYVQNQIDPLAVSNSNIFAGTFGKGVYMSSDNGSNWTAVNSGLLEDMRVSTLVINGNTLFAGTADGVGPYFSKDNGSSWKPIPLIPATTHYCFAFDPATVYLGTDNGVYKCALGANLGMGEMQINENNVALYPNPNNGQFAIEFRSSSREEIAMKVVNANGSVVYCLDKLAVNGNLTREFDLRNLAQGTYLLAFENNRMQITRQLVIAK